MNTRYGILPMMMLIALTGVSCLNPFAPRLDSSLISLSCSDPTKTQDIFCIFRNAYSFKDTTLYGSILAPQFVFIYTDYDRGVDVSWGRYDEMRTTNGLFQSAQSLTLTWNNEIFSEGNDTARTIVRSFNLTVTFNPSDIERIDGYANLKFARPTPADPWKLIRWRDESNY